MQETDTYLPLFRHLYVFCGVVGVVTAYVYHLQWLTRYVHEADHIRHLKIPDGYSLAPILFIGCAITILTALHIGNCLIWGILIWIVGAFPTLPDSIFFAFENYTTLANCQFPSEALPVYCAIGFSIDDILNVLESISASEVSLIG